MKIILDTCCAIQYIAFVIKTQTNNVCLVSKIFLKGFQNGKFTTKGARQATC